PPSRALTTKRTCREDPLFVRFWGEADVSGRLALPGNAARACPFPRSINSTVGKGVNCKFTASRGHGSNCGPDSWLPAGSESSGHSGLAQPFFKTFELLPVFPGRQIQRHRREAAKAADRDVGIVLLILRERQTRFVGVTRKRVGRRQQRVRADSVRIRIEGRAQKSHRLLVAPQQDESVSLTVQPGPPRGVARAKPVSLCKPVE